ncbi:MAG: hypothetical protein EOP04_11200, partial [Proteobacteria bacterium]
MSVAKNRYEAQSRSRESFRNRTSKEKAFQAKSFFVFKNWIRDSLTGAFLGAAKVNDRQMKESADLISTCYFNPAKQTDTCYCLAIDIDVELTHTKFLDERGAVSWPKVSALMGVEIPELLSSISDVTRSTGGKGFNLVIPISPMELTEKTYKAQRKGIALQRIIILILNSYGIGADREARGLKRDMPNWKNPAKEIDCNFDRRAEVAAKGFPVVSNLLKALSRHPSVYVKKSAHPERFLTTDSRSERGLALLYEHLFNELSDPCMSFSQIQSLTGLSRMSLTKFLRVKSPRWLGVRYLGREEGYRLTLKPSHLLTSRAEEVLRPAFSVKGELSVPEDVKDGERNSWIKQLVLRMKWSGVEEDHALKVTNTLCAQIPGASRSQNVRDVPAKIKCYYRRYQDLFGIRDRDILP